MGYLDRHLAPDEQVVFRTRLHPVVFAGTVWFAAFVVGAVALIVARNELAADTVRILRLAAVVIVVSSFASPYLRWRSSEFAVTTRRVLVKTGLVSVYTVELRTPEIEAIGVDQPLWGRLLGYGTLRIVGRGGTVETFPRVARPDAFREAVQRQAPRSARAGR